MAKLSCCNNNQKAKIFKISPTIDNIEHEYVIYLEKCAVCLKPSLQILRIDAWGNVLSPVRLKTSNITKFIASMSVIWKPDNFNHYKYQSGSFALEYNEFGTQKKCYQNLYSLQIGKIETDPLSNLAVYKEYKSNVCAN